MRWQTRLDGLAWRDAGELRVVRAATARARGLGLAGLPELPPWIALELPGCRSVHTVGMRFALDLVWLDGSGGVLRVDAGVGPWRARSCLRARGVIETRAGSGAALAAALGGGRG